MSCAIHRCAPSTDRAALSKDPLLAQPSIDHSAPSVDVYGAVQTAWHRASCAFYRCSGAQDNPAEPLSSVGSVEDWRTGPVFFPRIHDSHCDRIHSSLIAVRCFDNGLVVKQPVAWKEYCAEYWL